MTSPSEAEVIRELRARVLYYWAVGRGEPVVTIGASGIRKLLAMEDWSPDSAESMEVLSALRSGLAAELLPSGGVRIQVIASDVIEDIFLHWQMRTGKTRTKLTETRRSKVKARLSEGFTVAQLKSAVDGMMRSPWHRGENPGRIPYLGINVCFKDGDAVERFIGTGTAEPVEPAHKSGVDAIREEWKRKRGGES